MRIVLSNASGGWGGLHQVTEDLARGLIGRGHEVVVFCRPDSRLERRMREVAQCEPVLWGMDLSPNALVRCRGALRRHRPDVTVMLTKKDVRLTGPVAGMEGIPVVVRHANDQPLRNHWYHRWLYAHVATHHVVNSEATRRTILGSAPWLAPGLVSVVHNAIEVERFAGAVPEPLGLPGDALAVGFVGRLESRKGILDLLAAWPAVARAVPRAHLVIVGTGPLERVVRVRARALPRVRLLGYRQHVAPLMAAFDLLAMPSHWEGFGMVALEGMAAGVPVIASRASSLPEIVNDGVEGLLVEPRDPAGLARAIVALAGDEPLRARMSEAGPRRARHFSMETMMDRFESVLVRIAASRAIPGGVR